MAGAEGAGHLMFERLTAPAREVVIGARAQADQLGHRHVGTEHLLLALLAPTAGAPATILAAAGLTEASVRADIVRLIGDGQFGESDVAALEAIGIDLNAIKAKLEESFGPGALEPEVPPTRYGLFGRKVSGGRFTPRAKKVLELGLREALRLKHNYIGTEHLLLGLIREGEGLAAQIMHQADVPFDELRRDVERALRAAA
jgi:ATP-dependent Clp protease ATP-binding subunit ClpA